jgi:hypothetical protein
LPVAYHEIAAEFFAGELLEAPRGEEMRARSGRVGDVQPLATAAEAFIAAQAAANDDELESPVPAVPVEHLQAPPVNLPGRELLASHLQALWAEIQAELRQRPRWYKLADGVCVGPHGGSFRYVFRWKRAPDLYEPGILEVGEFQVGATVVGQADGDGRFELEVGSFLGSDVPAARFVVDPTFLLRVLYSRLNDQKEVDQTVYARLQALYCPPPPFESKGPSVHEKLSPVQARALQVCREVVRGYVWGPPGTGKTTTLGYVITDLISSGRRVLVLSMNNVAVDEAALAAFGAGLQAGRGGIVRLGRASARLRKAGIDLESVLEQEAVQSGLLARAQVLCASARREAGLEQDAPGSVRRCMEGVGQAVIACREARRRELARELSAALAGLRREFRLPEPAILESAKAVATTCALAMMRPRVSPLAFDQVLVDESSVLRAPDAGLIALGSGGRLTFFGDPRQLPPVIKTPEPVARTTLSAHPFRAASIDDPHRLPESCVFLDQQHRMAPPIREIISHFFYRGALRDGSPPEHGAVILCDTSHTGATALRSVLRGGGSRENPVHRILAASILEVVMRYRAEWKGLVLTPFRAQRKAFETEARTAQLARCRFGTVHASQGAEADVVVMDWTIAPGSGRSGFLDEGANEYLPNLVNVGLSRAKRLLVMIAHRGYIEEEYKGGLVGRLLEWVADKGVVFTPGRDLQVAKVCRAFMLANESL